MISKGNYDYDDCNSECDSKCTQTQLKNNLCDPACMIPACIFDRGYCYNQYCAAGCTYKMLGDGKYDSSCDNSNCYYDLGDTIFVDSPDVYVKNVAGSSETGSLSNPFKTLFEALAKIRYRKTNIFILDKDLELFKDSTGSADPLSKRTYSEITIQPKYCTATETTNCLTPGTEVWVNLGKSLSYLVIYGIVHIKNINFYHKYTFQLCLLCDYCRYTKVVDGFIYTDHNEKITSYQQFAYKHECAPFRSFAFIYVVYGGELHLEVIPT